jgi:exodeoxyribonuclease VII small subunit
MTKRERTPRFEAGLSELEGLVRRLEEGDMPLEDSLEAFERGMQIVKTLGERLLDIEKRVDVLLEKSGGATLVPAEAEDVDD